MINTDLHIHSRYSSDGEFEVAELAEKCKSSEVTVFSLTDHNSVRGVPDAVEFADKTGLDFIPGIEIDCNYDGINLHVLGYGIDYGSGDFSELEEELFLKEKAAFVEMIRNLDKLGFITDKDAILVKADGKAPTAELIAEVMLSDEKYYSPLLIPYMKGGERSDMPYINFYLDYFAQGKPAFVPVEYMNFTHAIEMIKDNGGIPIVAHPGLNLKEKEFIAEKLLDKGAEGLEVFNNYHDTDQLSYFASVVSGKNSIMTCGSDFHGKTKPLIAVGQFKFDEKYSDYLDDSVKRLRK